MKTDYWQSLNGVEIDHVSLVSLAQKYGTPLYVYDHQAILEALSHYQTQYYQPVIHYAVKANSNLSILKTIAEQGVGFDIVSQGELERVLQIGGQPEKIIFSGIGKKNSEIIRALEVGVGCLNIESEEELYRINQIAQSLNKKARVAFRVNPNVNPNTHPYISTGMKDNKFGIPIECAFDLYQKANELSAVQLTGVSCHIGSQITDFSSYLEAFDSLLKLVEKLECVNIKLNFIDIGGGVGVQTAEDEPVKKASELIEAIYKKLGNRNYRIHMQPGRSIIANAGFLITEVIGTKKQSEKKFIIVDAAMNDYIRPALYQAVPAIKNLSSSDETTEKADIVGPVCESGDFFIKDINISAQAGDFLVLAGVGAYGMSMSSQYNSRLRASELLIKDGLTIEIRKRENYEQLWENELL